MAKKNKSPKSKKFHLSLKDREYLTANLAQLLKASVPVGDALQSLADTSKSRLFKRAVGQISRNIDEGYPLWKALDNSGVVSAETLALIRLGEESGNMIENLEVAARQEEKQRVFQSKVRAALLYPGFVLGLTSIVGLAVAWFLLPKLSDTFSQLHTNLPLISRIFINIGLFLKANGIWAVPAIFGFMVLMVYVLFGAPQTKRFGSTLMFHVPGVSRLLHDVEVARFGFLLGTLLKAGLSVTQALRLLEQSTSAVKYKKFYAYLGKSFDEGYGFKHSFANYKKSANLIPPSVQQMIIAGEKSGSLPETLLTIGKDYETKADIATQNLEVILEPILLVIVWLGVLGVAIAVILPIYKLTGGLGQ